MMVRKISPTHPLLCHPPPQMVIPSVSQTNDLAFVVVVNWKHLRPEVATNIKRSVCACCKSTKDNKPRSSPSMAEESTGKVSVSSAEE